MRRIFFLTPLVLFAIFGLVLEYQYFYFLPKSTILIPPSSSSPKPSTETWEFDTNGGFWPAFAPYSLPRPLELNPRTEGESHSKPTIDFPPHYDEAQKNWLEWNKKDIASMEGTREWFLK